MIPGSSKHVFWPLHTASDVGTTKLRHENFTLLLLPDALLQHLTICAKWAFPERVLAALNGTLQTLRR